MIILTVKANEAKDSFHLFIEQQKDVDRVYYDDRTQEYYLFTAFGVSLSNMCQRLQSTGCVEHIDAKIVYRVK